MRQIILTTMLLAGLSTSACAQSQSDEAEDVTRTGRDVAATVIMSADEDSNGYLSLGEVEEFGEDIFLSMDYDDDQKITIEEFFSFDFGNQNVAERDGWEERFDTAKRIMFALRDRNADGYIDQAESRAASHNGFERADLNNDKQLSMKEAGLAYTPSVIFKAANPTIK